MRIKTLSCIVSAFFLCASVMYVPANASEVDSTAPYVFTMNHSSLRATESFHISVAANSTARANSGFSLAAGETVRINASYSPFSASVDFGLVSPSGIFYYFTATNGSIDETMQVNESGDYFFQIRNNSSNEIGVSGTLNY